jgi:hypothetical protein
MSLPAGALDSLLRLYDSWVQMSRCGGPRLSEFPFREFVGPSDSYAIGRAIFHEMEIVDILAEKVGPRH